MSETSPPGGSGLPSGSVGSGGYLVGLGLDTVDIDRFRAVLERRPAMVERMFGEGERAYTTRLANPVPSLAARFAAKEAVMKALGVGIWSIDWLDVEVIRERSGRPSLRVVGRAAALAERVGVREWRISMTHSDLVASAVVVGLA